MMVGSLCLSLALLLGGGFFQEPPSSQEEWEFLLEELMIQMAEENDWEEWFPEESLSEEFSEPETGALENESLSGETLLRLLLDENTDMETRLIILETLRQSEDPAMLEEVLRAFAGQESPPLASRIRPTKNHVEEPQIRLKPISRKVTILNNRPEPEEKTEDTHVQWINIIIGGLALAIATFFFFMRRGLTR